MNTPPARQSPVTSPMNAQESANILHIANNSKANEYVLDLVKGTSFQIHYINAIQAANRYLNENSCQIVLISLPLVKLNIQKLIENLNQSFDDIPIVFIGEPKDILIKSDLSQIKLHDVLDKSKITNTGFCRAIKHLSELSRSLNELKLERETLRRLVNSIEKGNLANIDDDATKQSRLYQVVDRTLFSENQKLFEQVKDQNRKLEKLAHIDSLTKIPNRLRFEKALKERIAHSKRHSHTLGLLFLDLDKFKSVNDSFGHQVGDKLLYDASRRIENCLREDDFLARLGGDEFAIILEEIKDTNDAGVVSDKIIHNFSKPFLIDDHKFTIGASIGIACYPEAAMNSSGLIKKADTAMYAAKKKGGNCYQYSNKEAHDKHIHRINVEQSLRNAINRNELYLMYQPIHNLQSTQMVGMEALVRWNHPSLGIVGPNEFIPIAEESNLILSIGDWVLKTACQQFKLWRDIGFKDLKLAINLSPIQLRQPDFLNKILCILDETKVPLTSIELEVTEQVLMDDTANSVELLKTLDNYGAEASIDDFGTGYSSLIRLKDLPISTLKIDQSFIQGIATNAGDEAIVSLVITLARKLELGLVAEGIETKEQLEFLIKYGCEKGQGYHYSKPLKINEMTDYLEN